MDEQCDLCGEYSDETIETDDGTVICNDCQGIIDDEMSLMSS
jgi:formylmethanofuran dehydrogenase subunit E